MTPNQQISVAVPLWDLVIPMRLASTAGPESARQAFTIAEVLTGHTLTSDGVVTPLTPESARGAEAGLQSILTNPGPLTPLVRWLTAHGPDAPATPSSKITRRQRADVLIDHGGPISVREAYDLDPGHPLIHVALARDEEDQVFRAGFLRDYDLQRLPPDAVICARAAQMLLQQNDKPRALTAARKALAIDPQNAAALSVQAEASK